MADGDKWGRAKRTLTSWSLTILSVLVVMYALGRMRAPALPEEAPSFTARTATGETFDLAALRGQGVVLNFWATWCGPCRFEVPALSRFAARHPEATVVGVVAPEPLERVHRAITELEIDYLVVLGTPALLRTYGVTTYPTTIFIGPDGRIESAHAGVLLDPQLELSALAL